MERDLARVADLLARERPRLTRDEIDRTDRRLDRSRVRHPRRLWRARASVVVCLSVGLLLTLAGGGLAISGFASTGAADHAQYPDQAVSSSRHGSTATTHTAQQSRPPSSLHAIRPDGRTAGAIVLRTAETRNTLPFTGYEAIPILMIGLALLVGGALLNRGARPRKATE